MNRPIFLGLLLIAGNLAAQQSFFDGTLADSDWTLNTRVFGNSGTVSAEHDPSAGNPGSARRILSTVGSESLIHGYHLSPRMIYDPSVSGPVRTVRFAFDFQALAGAEVGVGLLIKQGDNQFFGGYSIASGDSWQSRTINELRVDQFTPLDSVDLDFSAAAPQLQFGFITANSQGPGPGYDATVRIDNFSVIVNPLTLNIARVDPHHIRLTWPTNATGFTLEYASTQPAAEWTPVTEPATVDGDQFVNVLEAVEAARFFRLRKP